MPLDKPPAEFATWACKWMTCARVTGARFEDMEAKIDEVSRLWREPIPGRWIRKEILARLIRSDYQRGHTKLPRGEALIEGEILGEPRCSRVCGQPLLDGVNAVPIVGAETGQSKRLGNVEADMLLLLGASEDQSVRQVLVEVKDTSNHAWYAVVEAARQLRLFLASPYHQEIFRKRARVTDIPEELPTVSLVVAPLAFYTGAHGAGQKPNFVAPAKALCARLLQDHGVSVRLAVWHPERREVRDL